MPHILVFNNLKAISLSQSVPITQPNHLKLLHLP